MKKSPNVIVAQGYIGPRTISRLDDSFVKYLLSLSGHEDLLLSVVNSVMRNKKHQQFKSVAVKNPFNLKQQQLEQETIMDIKAVTDSNETILLEMQVKESNVFFDRVVDYVMRNAKITESVLLPRNKIKKKKLLQINSKQVISINFLGFPLYKDLKIAHTTHMMHCCENLKISSKKIILHMLDLTKGNETIEDAELKQWFNFFNNKNFDKEKEMIAQQSPIMRKAVEAYDTFVSNDDCMNYAEKHRLFKLYQQWDKDAATEKALEKGIEQGLEQGARDKAFETAKLMKQSDMPLVDICKFTGLTEKEVRLITN